MIESKQKLTFDFDRTLVSQLTSLKAFVLHYLAHGEMPNKEAICIAVPNSDRDDDKSVEKKETDADDDDDIFATINTAEPSTPK